MPRSRRTDVGSRTPSDESGRVEVYVRPFPDVERGRWQVSRDGGSKPLWSRDGREIFFSASNRALMAAEVALDAEFVPGPSHAAVRRDALHHSRARHRALGRTIFPQTGAVS